MSLTIWQTLGNTFYQGDDGRSIRTNGAAGNSDLDLIAPMGFGGSGRGSSGFIPTPGSIPPKLQPLNLKPKDPSSAGLGAANNFGGDFGGLKGGLTRQGPLPSSLTPLPDLKRISPRNVGADPIGKNLPSRKGFQPTEGIRDLAGKLQGQKGASGGSKGASGGSKGLPGTPQPKTAPAPQRLPFAEPAPAPKGLLGLKPSPRPANQPKTGTPNPKNSLPAQRRDPRTTKPFPGKPENQPLGDRPSKRSPKPTSRPNGIPLGNPGSSIFPKGARIFRALYRFEVKFQTGNGTDLDLANEFAQGYGPVIAIRQANTNGGTGMLEYYNGFSWGTLGTGYSYGTFGAPYTLRYIGGPECIDGCNNPPYDDGAPIWSPLTNPTPNRPANYPNTPKTPAPYANPTPIGNPSPFPKPVSQPLPAPTQKPQQQPKPDANKEPQRSPSAQRNPATKPKPTPVPQPAPTPTASGSGSFPKPATSGTPEGSGNTKPGSDFNPNTGATPPSPSPTPNYPEPSSPKIQPLPSPTPIPSTGPTPNYNPIEDKNPDPKTKEPVPVVQFPPFPVAPKLNSGNACKTADPCTQKISSGVDSANDKADDLGKKVKDILDGVDKALQVLDIGLLIKIDKKLGAEVEGGLSGQGNKILNAVKGVGSAVSGVADKLGKFAKWARLGQLVSVLTLITTLHNALMLSRSLGETLLSMLSNGLAVFGIKDDNGSPYDLGDLIGKSVEAAMKETIGTENYTTLSTNFKKANRIYQAAANLGNSIQSLRFSVVSALETIGGWNARIGNALKRSGVVNESSYAWMNPTPNFDNKFTRALETVENTVSQIDSVASEILSAQESVKQIGEQTTELQKSLGLGTEKPQTENKPQKDKAIATKTASAAPNIEATDLSKPGV